ncbi:MAG: DUF2892 domain-containing protein [Syntrophomonadaceae bacterium]|nr:DUF2892 domain-containing protein [Syntrophomonadaceae bacterium]
MDLSFQRNLGIVDRVIRIVSGIVLAYLAIFYPLIVSSTIRIILGVFGIFMIIEGFLAY